ncbi:hypothetical protein CAPTEDRAFT_211964, partial [Capitella teleta]
NKQRNCQSARDRSNAWIEIALSIQGIGPIERTVSEVKKKKQCWFSEVKQKAARLRSLQGQTGAAGGIEAGDFQLSATEDRIVSIMGDTVISEVVTLSQESVVLDEKPKPKKAKKEEASVTIALQVLDETRQLIERRCEWPEGLPGGAGGLAARAPGNRA